MFSVASFVNVSSDTVNLLSAGDFSLKNLDCVYEYDGQEVPKQQDSGNNPAHTFVRRLVLTATVQILGSSQTDYWTNRHTFARGFLVTAGAQASSYNHGTLSVTPTGGASMYVDVNVTGLALPLRNRPSQSAFVSTATVTMRADYGYWRATSGGAVVYF
jgi:hypothetical protein